MKILITGGAGFIGSNVVDHFASQGNTITIVDNLSRPNVIENLKWLLKNHRNITFIEKNIQDNNFTTILREQQVIFHFAAQVGVQSSIANPNYDFLVNTYGTFRLLDNCRQFKEKPFIIFASTNKVYGELKVDQPVSESQQLSFCTPYGCSKGAAEQYMLDFYRVYDLPTVVLRMSCIYGQRQWGTEEQGWLCHFMRAKLKNEPVTIYGDGSQQRDILHIDDYLRLCDLLIQNKDKVKGDVFNIGGGKENTITIGMALRLIGVENYTHKDWRPSDQKYYVSDIRKIKERVDWEPKIGVSEGLGRLEEWVKSI